MGAVVSPANAVTHTPVLVFVEPTNRTRRISRISVDSVPDCSGIVPIYRTSFTQKFARSSTMGSLKLQSHANTLRTTLAKGKYELRKLSIFPDIHLIPSHVEIHDIRWMSGKPSGQMRLPDSFNGEVPVSLATHELLSYYGCSMASCDDSTIKLRCFHEIMDFEYSADYKDKWVLDPTRGAGGLGVEMHKFIHLECPLEDDSGYFLIGKRVTNEYTDEEALHLTAFRIPKFHTVYVPPDTIHSNDHMKGHWRTMLCSFTEEDTRNGLTDINHVVLKAKDATGSWTNVDLTFQDPMFTSPQAKPKTTGWNSNSKDYVIPIDSVREKPTLLDRSAPVRRPSLGSDLSSEMLESEPSEQAPNVEAYLRLAARLNHRQQVSRVSAFASRPSIVRMKSFLGL